jgi:hypothetical protein
MERDPAFIARAVKPNIFDGAADTELILPLVLANLASPRLWALAEKLKARLADFPDDGDPRGVSSFLRATAKQIDRDCKHVHAAEVSALFGDLNLAHEKRRLGANIVDAALRSIETSARFRLAQGNDRQVDLIEAIAAGHFPAFTYNNIDVIRAYRNLLQKKSAAPAGLTSCLDEVAMFAALGMTMPENVVYDMVILASPVHYTAFGRDGQGRAFWFHGKNRFYTKADWDKCVTEDYGGDPHAAFSDRLVIADRIMTIEGTFDFASGVCRITPDNLAVITRAMEDFFGAMPRDLASALTRPIHFAPPSTFAALYRRFLALETRDRFVEFLKAQALQPDIETDLVAASFRALEGCDPRVFLIAARESRLRGLDLTSIDTVLNQLRALPHRDSIFEDRERMAMPDETLLFGGGTDRDLGLLFHVALERMGHAQVTTLMTPDETYVIAHDLCFAMTNLLPTQVPHDDAVLYRIAS